ncbi:FAD-binding and (Fe-S)-binding domain-containing protein [Gilvibacter sediminis]|uniref:FAD-binding and (Fe-S)-binding domain-containing protein n=1 Tax=Gilvibacter sediminis TaxID=379071 RepID=UPI00235071EE|nr:FAD-binding and (Fe-S)-binding domain-containing protein [Gilvibacter sediminis]MDC7998358.1 FAD-linked oxidase C-terminal domain-containing protein [Gilvibacter sediminis]
MSKLDASLKALQEKLQGEIHWDRLHKQLYATDASVYRELPLAVAYPKSEADLQALISFATTHQISLTARTAGTSLAGQCVTDGIVLDFSKHFTQVHDIDIANRRVTVAPGVIRDDLNEQLAPQGLLFGPNTSTSNRCMIGGMVGNNSSGTTSIRYGVTRDKLIALDMILYDGSKVSLKEETLASFNQVADSETALGKIYRQLKELLASKEAQQKIHEVFPKKEIHRRNTGYALDALLEMEPFGGENPFNLAKLIAGSEGTLGLVTKITLALDELPPKHRALIAPQYASVEACLKDVAPLMRHKLYSCELMDKKILDCTVNNAKYRPYRAFIEQDPQAVLLLELCEDSPESLNRAIDTLLKSLKDSGRAYALPVLKGVQIDQAMELRKAGLGLLGNMIGDAKAVACIEDTAVAVEDLSEYISEFTQLMTEFDQQVVYYAHAGAGELHLRPILNLKQSQDVKKFKDITAAVAVLVKKYRGSLSGEHGDGIVRGSLLPEMLGEEVYGYIKSVKQAFDPHSIFNRGKIVDAWAIDQRLRYVPDRKEPKVTTFLDFSESQGLLRATEQCNGSGDCRKLPGNGTLCPSYHATRDEKDTTRARANVLRELLTNTVESNPFTQPELHKVMDLCISCKACSNECPSNVNVAKFKAEIQYQHRKEKGEKPRDRFFAKSDAKTALLAKLPKLSNALFIRGFMSNPIKRFYGIDRRRKLPALSTHQFEFHAKSEAKKDALPQVLLYIDEFCEHFDKEIAQDAYDLLAGLGYAVKPIRGLNSARALLSKGYLEEASEVIDSNVAQLAPQLGANDVLVGIEPSAILGFRDEYRYMSSDKAAAEQLAKQAMLIEEFIAQEAAAGNISSAQFTTEEARVKIHNHCYQKALSDQKCTFDMLNLPENYKPTIIPSGCCGMAGSFGYEKEHYEISMKIGAQTLFPAVSKADSTTLIAANGTSCRHQIEDGTRRIAQHPVTILKKALKAH